MFQAEYSSGSPLRMLVDLRASVEHALANGKAKAGVPAKPTAKPLAGAPKPAPAKPVAAKPSKAFAASATQEAASTPSGSSDAPEFEVSGSSGWDQDSGSQGKKK